MWCFLSSFITFIRSWNVWRPLLAAPSFAAQRLPVCVSAGHFSAPSPCTKTARATWASSTSPVKSPHWSRMALLPATACWLIITSVKSTDKTLLDSRSDTRFCISHSLVIWRRDKHHWLWRNRLCICDACEMFGGWFEFSIGTAAYILAECCVTWERKSVQM